MRSRRLRGELVVAVAFLRRGAGAVGVVVANWMRSLGGWCWNRRCFRTCFKFLESVGNNSSNSKYNLKLNLL